MLAEFDSLKPKTFSIRGNVSLAKFFFRGEVFS
jgi:hypothetical protein